MNTISYANKEYSINEEALNSISDEWKAILYKANHDRRFNAFYGEQSEIDRICNAGSSRLEEYTAEEIAAHPDDMPSGLKGPGFWAVTCDSDDGEQFDNFWDAAEHIITDDKRNGGTWTASEMVAALKDGRPEPHFAMIEALMSIDILEEVKEEAE